MVTDSIGDDTDLYDRGEVQRQLQPSSHTAEKQVPSMQHSQRLDQRLHVLREEVRTMTREKERGEREWRERLQHCQRQLKAKEEEMSRQSRYFENFKTQLQHKLSLARDREQSLQTRIYSLEKQLLEFTVSAAAGVAMVSTVRITAGTVAHMEEQNRLPSMRGEGEGEEEKKEERRKQWQLNKETGKEETREGDEGKTDTKKASNNVRLQGFILSLQEDLRVLLEREENGMSERRTLMEQLQEAQENSHLLGATVEDIRAELNELRMSESFLMEEVEELKEENQRLQQILRDAANQTPSESTSMSPGTSSPRWGPALCSASSNSFLSTAKEHSSPNKSGEVQPVADEERVQTPSVAVLPVDHQGAAEHLQDAKEDCYTSAKTRISSKHPRDSLNLFHHFGSKSDTSFPSLTFTTESLNEFKLGNIEETLSEESDALREAFRSLGLGEDLAALKEQRKHLEVTLQQTQEQLKAMAQENVRLKSQLRKQEEEQQIEAKQRSSGEQIKTPPTYEGDKHPSSSPSQEDAVIDSPQDDLVQALNHENRALADRIQELLAHIQLREEEIRKEEMYLKETISKLEENGVRLEQENQEQACLISELTKKTEDDLNTIMDLKQKLITTGEVKEESKDCTPQSRAQWQVEHTADESENFLLHNQEEYVESLVVNMLQDEKTQVSQETGSLTTALSSSCQHNQNESLQNVSPQSLRVTLLADQVEQLTNSIHSLKTEQDELTGSVNSLREQQREVSLSVQTQTEEKQQLTRMVWTLKEQKDCVSQALIGLKQEREQLSRVVCRLKDERDQFIRSMSGLKEEKEQLTKSLSALQRDKEAIIESLSSSKEERDRIVQSLQGSQTESSQLSKTVLHLKQQRDKLTDSPMCLTEQRDQERLAPTSSEEHERLIKTISSLKEEKEKIEHSIRCLNQEERQIMQIVLGLREERNSLQVVPIQTNTKDRSQKQQLLNEVIAGKAKKILTGTGDAAPGCETNNHRGRFIQEQSEPVRETEALVEKFGKTQEELDKSYVESKRLHSELSQSEARREDAEKKVAEQAMRLTDAVNQMEDVKKDNQSLTTRVEELQNKLSALLREKSNALSRKVQIEEQYNILTAQLKAKTVALEELNSEFIALKRGQGSRDDLSTVLVSIRARYIDIRAKYDALLKRKSQTDMDVAPLKAKLSCLVGKCQERNIMLAQMMKAMHRQGCMDPKLTQQVEHLLSDAALQDYAAAFTTGSNLQTRDGFNHFTQEFISTFQGYTSRSVPDQTFPDFSTSVNKNQSGVSPKSEDPHGESDGHPSIFPGERQANLKGSSGFTATAARTQRNSPVQDDASIQVSPVVPEKASMTTSTSQSSPPSGLAQLTGRPDTFGRHQFEMKEKSSSGPTGVSGSLQSHTPSSSSSRVSLNRRLSSPEKILNLHEQLQKTLMSSFQAAESRGRGQQPRRSLSLSAPADLSSPTTKNLTLSFTHTNSFPAASSPATDIPAVTAKPATSNKSATLFHAVACRSADAALSLSMFTNQSCKADVFKTSALSSSLNLSPCPAVEPREDKSISSSGTDFSVPPNQTKKICPVTDINKATPTSSAPLILDSSVPNPKSTLLALTVSSIATSPKLNICNVAYKTDGADLTGESFTFTTSCHSAQSSPTRRSNMSPKESNAVLEKTPRFKTEAPAEVRSVDVIKKVGQSSLLIGWERPLLDELGCSNGTFVYGYRVLVDGDFHKSVMSSACTKCILENIDLSVPVHISVQTLGSNGLRSNSVQTKYSSISVKAFQGPSSKCAQPSISAALCRSVLTSTSAETRSHTAGRTTPCEAQVNQSGKLISHGYHLPMNMQRPATATQPPNN